MMVIVRAGWTMLYLTGIVRGEIAALRGEYDKAREQIEEIASWLGIEPVDVTLLVATLGGLLAYIF